MNAAQNNKSPRNIIKNYKAKLKRKKTFLINIFKNYKYYKIKACEMKISVLMSDNRPLETENYYSLAAAINYEYCKKYNYDFTYYRPYLNDINSVLTNNCMIGNELRHAAWSKLLSTSKMLETTNSDYIVYIDSDCIFKDFNISLEEFIGMNHNNKNIIFLNNKPWHYNMPCSGFYICRVCSEMKIFLKDWYNVDIPEKNRLHPFEQDGLWKILNIDNISLVDTWMFEEREGQYLRHVASHESYNRIPYFRNFIMINQINFEDNIKNINVVDYNTME